MLCPPPINFHALLFKCLLRLFSININSQCWSRFERLAGPVPNPMRFVRGFLSCKFLWMIALGSRGTWNSIMELI